MVNTADSYQLVAMLLAFPLAWSIAVKSVGLHGQHWLVRHFLGLLSGVFAALDVAILFVFSLDLAILFWAFSLLLLFYQSKFSPFLHPISKPTAIKPDLNWKPYHALPKKAKQKQQHKAIATGLTQPDTNNTTAKKRRPAKTSSRRQLGTWEFTYKDSKGDISERRVAVNSVDSAYLMGFCLSARANRTFRIDRIQSDLVNIDTGEIVSPEDFSLVA